MHRKHFKLATLVFWLITILLLTLTSDLSAQGRTAVTIGMAGDAETFDGHLSTSTISFSYQFSVFDGLVNLDEDQKPLPGLATSWRTIDDNTWLFKLREGLTFHNGEKFDAHSVKFSLERVKTHPKSLQKAYLSLMKEVKVIDLTTVQIITDKPSPDLPINLSNIAIYPEKYMKGIGEEKFSYQPVGTGPYKLTEWVKDRHEKLTANEAYWGRSSEN